MFNSKKPIITAAFFFFFCGIVSVIAVLISTKFALHKDTGTVEPNQIGDFLGGVLNPFFTLCAVCVTALAFYAQYDANIMIQRDTKLREFESQFYEMMRVHQSNIERLLIQGMEFRSADKSGSETEARYLAKSNRGIPIDSGENQRYYFDIKGINVFYEIHKELDLLIKVYKATFGNFDKDAYFDCYKILFNGIESFKFDIKADEIESQYEIFLTQIDYIELAYYSGKRNTSRSSIDAINKIVIELKHKPFNGFGYIIGNHFRQLFQTVKFVVNSKIVTDYEDKMKYVNMLRAQMTYEEIIILFYNWIGYAPQWQNEENSFLCDYRLIHNLWHTRLDINNYTDNKLCELRDMKNVLHNKPIFELKYFILWV